MPPSRDELISQLRDRDSGPSRQIVDSLTSGVSLDWENSDRIPEHLFWLSGLGNKLHAAGQDLTFETNKSEIEKLISALSSQVDSTITLGGILDSEVLYSVLLTADGVLLGCLALPKGLPRRC
jgi:hypothetical protein